MILGSIVVVVVAVVVVWNKSSSLIVNYIILQGDTDKKSRQDGASMWKEEWFAVPAYIVIRQYGQPPNNYFYHYRKIRKNIRNVISTSANLWNILLLRGNSSLLSFALPAHQWLGTVHFLLWRGNGKGGGGGPFSVRFFVFFPDYLWGMDVFPSDLGEGVDFCWRLLWSAMKCVINAYKRYTLQAFKRPYK